MAPTVRISGRLYPERPPNRLASMSPARRMAVIVDSLRFAANGCGEPERGLYKSVLEALAFAENTAALAVRNSCPQMELSPGENSPHAP